MPAEEDIREFENVKERRSGGITQTIKNTPTLIFVFIVGMIILFFWMIKDSSFQNNKQLLIIALAIIAFVFFFQKKADAGGLISKDVAKRLAVEAIENEKEEFYISGDIEITPKFCRLQRKMGEPLEWHVGIKLENREGKIDSWRVDIHPYNGTITGLVKEPTEYDGTSTPDIVVVYPGHYMEE